jgi:CHAT domain-containing protein
LIGIPWGALAPLADRPVRVVPSAVAWWRSSLRTATTDKVVLVAGPGLAGAEDEIAAIAHRYDGAVRFAPDAATSDDVKQAAAGAQLVHIAAHGRLRSDSPTFSSVQLADGPLTVHDLEGLPEPAHHWVLAACDLGNPGALAGPALEGVLAALLSGGAGAAVAAVVSVPDLPTRDLMVALHDRRATGMSLADALRRAGDSIDTTEPTGFVAATAFSCYGGG